MFSVQEMYKYSVTVRRNFAERMKELSWDEATKNKEASFYSMKNILLHIIDNEDWMVNWVIQGRSNEYVRKKWEEYADMNAIISHMNDVEERTKRYLERFDDSEAHRAVVLSVQSGTFQLSVEECLFQSFTEQLYHMGELIALFWQLDIEPPKMQWFWNNPRRQVGQL